MNNANPGSRMIDHVHQPRGTVRLWVYRRGILIDEWVDDNLVVNAAKPQIAHLVAADVTNKSVTTIGFGTGTTAAASGDTALTSPYTKALDSHSYPASGSVQFNFSLGSAEDNGMAISEFGLICADNTLFARKVRGTPLNKASDITITGTWTIAF